MLLGLKADGFAIACWARASLLTLHGGLTQRGPPLWLCVHPLSLPPQGLPWPALSYRSHSLQAGSLTHPVPKLPPFSQLLLAVLARPQV